MVMVQEEAGGGTVLISRPQAHLTLSSCYISEGACVGAIISAPAIWPLVSGNEELDGHLGGRRRDKRGIYLRGFFLAIGSWHYPDQMLLPSSGSRGEVPLSLLEPDFCCLYLFLPVEGGLNG